MLHSSTCKKREIRPQVKSLCISTRSSIGHLNSNSTAFFETESSLHFVLNKLFNQDTYLTVEGDGGRFTKLAGEGDLLRADTDGEGGRLNPEPGDGFSTSDF